MKRLICVLLATGCGVGAEETIDDAEEAVQDLSIRSPADRVVIWQQNIEAMKGAKVGAWRITSSMVTHEYKPDIVMFAEAWQKVLCGDYLNPDSKGNADLQNWKDSPHANGLATACRQGNAPLPNSVLGRIGSAIWGSGHVGHRRPFDDLQGSTGSVGTAVAWDTTRFRHVDSFAYDDSSVLGCSKAAVEYKRTAVLLRDTRRTSDPSDDRLVAVAALHYGSGCPASADRWIAEEMVKRWGARGLDLRIIGGDFNASVDETSATYAERRAEEHPRSWYLGFTANTTWLGGRFLDPVKVKHPGICGQWTYPNVASCADETACSGTCPGFGIGGKLDRIDFTFVSDAAGKLKPERVLSTKTNDNSAGYSDHKATYVVVGW